MSVDRPLTIGIASGATAVVGVLFATCLIVVSSAAGSSGPGVSSIGYTIIFFAAAMIGPSLALGGVLGALVLAPYFYAKTRFGFGPLLDVVVLGILCVRPALWYLARFGPSVEPTVVNHLVLFFGASVGALPLNLRRR